MTDAKILAYCAAREALKRAEVASKEDWVMHTEAVKTAGAMLLESMQTPQRHRPDSWRDPGSAPVVEFVILVGLEDLFVVPVVLPESDEDDRRTPL